MRRNLKTALAPVLALVVLLLAGQTYLAHRLVVTSGVVTYVSPTGLDTNDCLSSTSACKTFQHAYDIICNNYDTQQIQGVVSVLAGTYTFSSLPIVQAVSQCLGGNAVQVIGAGSATTIINLTGLQPGGQGAVFAENGKLIFEGFTLNNTGNLANMAVIVVDNDATIDAGDIVITNMPGSSSVGLKANDPGGLISLHGNITFNDTIGGSGSSIGYPIFLSNHGTLITNGFGITFSGTAWTVINGCLVDGLALLDMTNTTVTGLGITTGTRWSVNNGGVTKGTSSGAHCAGNANGAAPNFGLVN